MLPEKKIERGLSSEEIKTLENMRNELKKFFELEAASERAITWEAHTSVHTAAQGYAVITDILSRVPKP